MRRNRAERIFRNLSLIVSPERSEGWDHLPWKCVPKKKKLKYCQLLSMERGYFVRLTPADNSERRTMEEICTALELIGINKYFICEETATRLHYHLCIYTTKSAESLRYQIKRYVQGQIYISQKDIQDQVKAVAYCMKDGLWKQRYMDVNVLLQAQAVSHKKEAKFEKALNEIIDTDQSTRSLVRALVELHVKHNRRIYPQHIEAIARLSIVKHKPDYVSRLIDRITESIDYNI